MCLSSLSMFPIFGLQWTIGYAVTFDLAKVLQYTFVILASGQVGDFVPKYLILNILSFCIILSSFFSFSFQGVATPGIPRVNKWSDPKGALYKDSRERER